MHPKEVDAHRVPLPNAVHLSSAWISSPWQQNSLGKRTRSMEKIGQCWQQWWTAQPQCASHTAGPAGTDLSGSSIMLCCGFICSFVSGIDFSNYALSKHTEEKELSFKLFLIKQLNLRNNQISLKEPNHKLVILNKMYRYIWVLIFIQERNDPSCTAKKLDSWLIMIVINGNLYFSMLFFSNIIPGQFLANKDINWHSV